MAKGQSTRPDYIAGCEDCGKVWCTANAMGVAARHHQATGHKTYCNVAYCVVWE